ncbi:GIP, partial [Symbiodinium necroappetens]
AWQVEAPWPPPAPRNGWRSLDRVSRGEFLDFSQSLVVLGQMSALGSHEVGLYDAALSPPRGLSACAGHWDFVADVCAISAQSFASASLDGSLLLWDLRSGLGPTAKAGFREAAPRSL